MSKVVLWEAKTILCEERVKIKIQVMAPCMSGAENVLRKTKHLRWIQKSLGIIVTEVIHVKVKISKNN